MKIAAITSAICLGLYFAATILISAVGNFNFGL